MIIELDELFESRPRYAVLRPIWCRDDAILKSGHSGWAWKIPRKVEPTSCVYSDPSGIVETVRAVQTIVARGP